MSLPTVYEFPCNFPSILSSCFLVLNKELADAILNIIINRTPQGFSFVSSFIIIGALRYILAVRIASLAVLKIGQSFVFGLK